jgi:nicotinamidase-related amidase
MDVRTAALIVIDMQNGFLNHHSRHVLPAVTDLVDRWTAAGRPVVFTRYHNHAGSPFQRVMGWTRLQHAPETDIAPDLRDRATAAHALIDKPAYTCFTDEAVRLLDQNGWTELVFCGVATESCVLKSAVDAFERGYTPWLVTDACASDAGPEVHQAGLIVARRLIGPRQLITTTDLLTTAGAAR